MIQNLLPFVRIRTGHMFLDHLFQFQHIVFGRNLIGRNHFLIGLGIQVVMLIQYISDTAAHACREVLAHGTHHYDTSACHVFTAMITHALDHRNGSGVPYTEALARHAVNEGLPGCRPIQCHVTDNDILILLKPGSSRRVYDQLAAGKSFAKIIVGISHQFQCESLRNKSAETLPAGTAAQNMVTVLIQRIAKPSGNLGTEDRAEGTVRIVHIHGDASLLPCLQCLRQLL